MRGAMNPEDYVVVLEEDPLIHALLEPALVIADVPDPQSAGGLIRSLREYAAPILVLSAGVKG
jgi:hypothetical protein